MVKVIIQTDDKMLVKEGEFVLGAVVSEVSNVGYGADAFLIGKVGKEQISQIVASLAVSLVREAHEDNILDKVEALIELKEKVEEKVREEVVDNKDGILTGMAQYLDEMGKEMR